MKGGGDELLDFHHRPKGAISLDYPSENQTNMEKSLKKLMFTGILTVLTLHYSCATAQNAGDAVLLKCRVNSGSLMVTGGPPVTLASIPGVTYHYYYLPSSAEMALEPPDATGNSTPGDLNWLISGSAAQNIILQFVLPFAFISESTGAIIPISYNNQSATLVTDNGGMFTWNPNAPSPPLALGSSGSASLYLGFDYSVPVNAPVSSDYLAYFYVSAESTGF